MNPVSFAAEAFSEQPSSGSERDFHRIIITTILIIVPEILPLTGSPVKLVSTAVSTAF
jgi:hypothetical protein